LQFHIIQFCCNGNTVFPICSSISFAQCWLTVSLSTRSPLVYRSMLSAIQLKISTYARPMRCQLDHIRPLHTFYTYTQYYSRLSVTRLERAMAKYTGMFSTGVWTNRTRVIEIPTIHMVTIWIYLSRDLFVIPWSKCLTK